MDASFVAHYDSLRMNAEKQHMYTEMLKGKGCTMPLEILIEIYDYDSANSQSIAQCTLCTQTCVSGDQKKLVGTLILFCMHKL